MAAEDSMSKRRKVVRFYWDFGEGVELGALPAVHIFFPYVLKNITIELFQGKGTMRVRLYNRFYEDGRAGNALSGVYAIGKLLHEWQPVFEREHISSREGIIRFEFCPKNSVPFTRTAMGNTCRFLEALRINLENLTTAPLICEVTQELVPRNESDYPGGPLHRADDWYDLGMIECFLSGFDPRFPADKTEQRRQEWLRSRRSAAREFAG